jgi:hypothetical protein
LGGVDIPYTDYLNVSNLLTNYVGKDFTFIHPEVLDKKCKVVDGKLHLENRIDWEDFKVLIVPSFIDTPITISGRINLEKWNPHNGSIETLKTKKNQNRTSIVHLKLAPFHSCFLIGDM